MMNKNENEIIKDIIGGNQEAFSYIVNSYKDLVFNVVNKIIHNYHEAEDVTQDVFIKVYRNIHRFKFESKFSTWVYSIAYREAIDTFRKKNNSIPFESIENTQNIEEIDNLTFDDDSSLIYDENLINKLKTEVDKLNQTDKIIITLYYNLNNSIEEISKITNLSESNIKVKLYRTRKHLLKKLTDNEQQ